MKYLIAISTLATWFAVAPASAQQTPPALPPLTQQQAQALDARVDAYRRATDARVARGEINADEASRLIAWREWQLAQQLAATSPQARETVPPVDADVPPDYYGPRDDLPPASPPYGAPSQPPAYVPPPARDVYVAPSPAYGPYYPAPYYAAPRPYAYWGPSICAGGFSRHFAGRLCF
jgi:hypothetical protein